MISCTTAIASGTPPREKLLAEFVHGRKHSWVMKNIEGGHLHAARCGAAEPGYPTRRRVSSPAPGWTMNRATAAARHRSEGKARIAGPSVFRSIGTRSASRLSLNRGLAVIRPHSISAASARANRVFILPQVARSDARRPCHVCPAHRSPGSGMRDQDRAHVFHQCSCTRVMLAKSGSNPAGTQRLAFCMV